MKHNLTIITLGVSDLSRAKMFYENAFGWTAHDVGNADIAFYQLPGIVVGLYGRNELAEDIGIPSTGEGFRAITLAMNKKSEAEVDELVEHALQHGAILLKPAQKVFWGGDSGYIQDPDGNAIEVAYNPFWGFDERGVLKL